MVVELDRTLGSLHDPGHSLTLNKNESTRPINERCINV